MKDGTKSTQAIVSADKTARFQCPSCQKTYRIDLSGKKGINQGTTLNGRCKCGAVFQLTVERRQHQRKPTKLTGAYLHQRQQLRGGITIKNLSKSGAGIEIHTPRDIFEGDVLTLKFSLNDIQESYVAKNSVIRKKNDQSIGVEFIDPPEPDDPLSRYLD